MAASLWKPRNITTRLMNKPFVCTLHMLVVKPSLTKCVETYSYLYFIYRMLVKGGQTCHYPRHWLLSTFACLCSQCVFIPHVYVHSVSFCGAQLFTSALIFQMLPQDKTEPPPPTIFWSSLKKTQSINMEVVTQSSPPLISSWPEWKMLEWHVVTPSWYFNV